jgi:RND family efflux transporter MFP subunit
VDESKLANVRVGQAVEAVLEADRKLSARVSEIVPSVDAASRTYIVKLDLPATPQLRTGMFGRAIFPLGMQKVVAVPLAALMERGQLQSVFVVEDGVAHTRLVTTGRRIKDAVEVLSGLNAGEKVVLPLPVGLQDGARVEVRQ